MADSPKPYSDLQVRTGTFVIRWMSKLNTKLYRWTKGRVGGRFLRGAPVCLVTTIGRKSGQARTVPLLYMMDGEDVIIVASKGGMPDHPDWYRNLRANPAVDIEVKDVRRSYTARTVDGAEKAELWPRLVAMYKDYADYQARTDRDIPVVRCTPVG